MLEPGQTIVDRYTVERVIAHGGMATVYVVRHKTLDSLYALKVLDLPTSDIKRRLLQEGRIQASLRHPNIVAVTDAIDIDSHPALVMEYVDGPTLSDVIQDGIKDLELAESWFRAILGAVSYAHARGLVHRDLKPDNVLMARLTQGYLPKVADFGIAKVVQEYMQRGDGPMTRTGVGMGTPAYMPPEQMQSAGAVDHRADIFALGCILYEVMCGTRAFPGENILSILNAAAEGDYQPPWEHRKGLEERVVAAIDGALEPNPDARIQTCDELLAVLSGDTVRPTKTPPPLGVRRTPRRTEPEEEPVKEGMGLGKALLLGGLSLMLVAGVTMGAVAVAGGLAGIAFWSADSVGSSSGTGPAYDPKPASPLPEPEVVEVVPVQGTGKVVESVWDVQMHGWRAVPRVQDGVMKHEPDDPNNLLYLADVTLTYSGAVEGDPGWPWSLVTASGVEYDAGLACSMSLAGALGPWDSYDPGTVVRGEICIEGPENEDGLRIRFAPYENGRDTLWFALE